MKTITYRDPLRDENIEIAYCDYGNGQPVLLVHGWPLSKEMWEYQLADIINNENRVVMYDRRGFGKSSKPWIGYDYDSLAADLHQLIEQLDLREVILVGFSMGGGEIVRYLKNYGRSRVSRVALISSVLPFLMRTGDNPDGIAPEVFDEMISRTASDRFGFLEGFTKDFFSLSLMNKIVSKPLQNYYQFLAAHASMNAMLHCITSFSATDFRDELHVLEDIPLLLIHGDDDRIVPKEASTDRVKHVLPHAEYGIYWGGPHGLFYTHHNQLSKDLVNFINGVPYEIPEENLIQPVIPPFV